MLVADENRDRPAKQIELILTNGYEQYLQENFENAESRAEDIRGLALYANRYNSTEDFLSELALLSTERFKEPQPLVGEDVICKDRGERGRAVDAHKRASGKGTRVESRFSYLGRRR